MMTATLVRGVAAVAALALLSGCANRGDPSGIALAAKAAIEAGQGIRKPTGNGITATDAELRAFPDPLLRVTRQNLGTASVVGIVSSKGPAVTWASADIRSMTFFNGLLIQTRGLGNDLMSAKVPTVNVAADQVLREHYYLGGDDIVRRQRFFCAITEGGAERINLVGIAYDTRVTVERCVGDKNSFENRYWFDRKAGGLLQSVQWASPEIGSLLIEFVPRTGAVAARQQGSAPSVTIR